MSDNFETTVFQSLFSAVEFRYLENLLHDNLTISEIIALHVIASLKNPTIVEFANAIKISQSNATYVIHKLVHKGYITKVPSSTDGRVFLLSVTDLYHQQLNFYRNQLETSVEETLEELSPQQRTAVENFCTLLMEKVNQD